MLTDKFDVYRSEWLDLVFANRNHEYGAYELRKNYSRTLNKALIVAAAIFTSAIYFPMMYHKMAAGDLVPVADLTDQGKTVILDMKDFKQAPLPPVAPKADPVTVKTIRSVPPRVVPASQVTEEMPTVEDLKRATISTKTQEGIEAPSDVSPIETSTRGGSGTASEAVESNEPVILSDYEVYPEFPGGKEGFSRFLQKNLRYPASAAEAGVSGRVIVTFVVERDGSLSGIKVIKGIGFGCDEEALRVLRRSPAWSAAVQNGRKVRVQYTLPLMFQFTD